jgi:hypothetical protein
MQHGQDNTAQGGDSRYGTHRLGTAQHGAYMILPTTGWDPIRGHPDRREP